MGKAKDLIHKVERQYFYIWIILLIAFISFWFVFPIYTFDSFWYISYLDYFIGTRPLNEWFAGRGFTFPIILWLAYLIQPNSWGIEIILCSFYMLFSTYIFKLFVLIKSECFGKKLEIIDCIIVGIFIIFNPIIWGYAHLVLTESISVSLLIFYSYYALRFFFNRRKAIAKNRSYILFLMFSCIMTSILWFLKQSFFVNTIILAIILELGSIVYHLNTKKIIYMLLLIFSMMLSINVPTTIWYNIIEVNDDTFAGGLVDKICCLRYFYPENENIANGCTVKISIMNDNYDVIDNFDYTFEDGLKRLQYVWKCFQKSPGRLLMGYIDNYMLMSDVFQNPLASDGIAVYAYGSVLRDHPFQTLLGNNNNINLSGEHRLLVQTNIKNGYNSLSAVENARELLQSVNGYTDILNQYETINSPNFISKIMSNKFIWDIAMIWYTVLLIGTPIIFIWSLIKYLIDKSRSIMVVYGMFSAYAFSLIMMHVLTGQPIDRYAFPAYAAMLIILSVSLIKAYEWIVTQIRKRQ